MGWARAPGARRERKSAASAHNRVRGLTLTKALKECYFTGEAAGAAPKLKFTLGGFSLPETDLKYGLSFMPNRPAKGRAGILRMAVLYVCAFSLKRPRSTEIRFSVPSS